MSAAKPALRIEPTAKAEPEAGTPQRAAMIPPAGRRRFPTGLTGFEPDLESAPRPSRPRRDSGSSFQARVPVIIGEAIYRGAMPVDGVITGQLVANGSALTIRQRPRSGPPESEPELNGEISFKDMLRINGHVAGKVFSFKGTLIVDGSARVDASIDVAVAVISGTVNGDVIGHERVELGPCAVINGNISTQSLTMKPGAIFQGDCRMVKNENGDA